jgi:hypothetical protein
MNETATFSGQEIPCRFDHPPMISIAKVTVPARPSRATGNLAVPLPNVDGGAFSPFTELT